MNAPIQLDVRNAACRGWQCSICRNIGPETGKEIARFAHLRHVAAGETVVAEGEATDLVGSVVNGALRLQRTMADGRRQIVGLLMPPDMFGRVFAARSSVAIEASTDATLCCFDRANFETLLVRHSELEHRVLLAALDDLDAAREWMLVLGCQSVAERIASFLFLLCRRGGARSDIDRADGRIRVTVPVSRRDIAAYLGTTAESLSRTIRELARAGIIRILSPRQIEILDQVRLAALSGHEDFAPASEVRNVAWRQLQAV